MVGSSEYIILDQHNVLEIQRNISLTNLIIHNICQIEYPYLINILVKYRKKSGTINSLAEFNVILENFDDFTKNGTNNIYGVIIAEFGITYNQYVIDVFHCWNQNRPFDWWGLTNQIDIKNAYINSCFLWSGLLTTSNKNGYDLHCGLIEEEIDFFFLLGSCFNGDRGYMGSDLYTLKDCLLVLKQESKHLNPRITIYDHLVIVEKLGSLFFQSVYDLFYNLGYIVEKR